MSKELKLESVSPGMSDKNNVELFYQRFDAITNSYHNLASSQDEQTSVIKNEHLRSTTKKYQEAVLELLSKIKTISPNLVEKNLPTINEALRLVNFDITKFYNLLNTKFSDYKNFKKDIEYGIDYKNVFTSPIEKEKELYFCRKFISTLIENYLGENWSFDDILIRINIFGYYFTEDSITKFLTEQYSMRLEMIKNITNYLLSKNISKDLAFDLRLTLPPEFIVNEKDFEKPQQEPNYDEVSNFSVYLVTEKRDSYKPNGRYTTKVYNMSCNMELFFEKIVDNQDNLPPYFDLEKFCEENNFSFTLKEEKKKALHTDEDSDIITIFAHDLTLLISSSDLEIFNQREKNTPVQKKKTSTKKEATA